MNRSKNFNSIFVFVIILLFAVVLLEYGRGLISSNNVTYTRTSLDKGKYIAYTFPKIISVPEAKYGVIDIGAMKYYTFESDSCGGYWAIGSQDIGKHSLIEMVQVEMSLEEFLKSLKRSPVPTEKRSGCLSVIVLIIAVLLL